MLKTESTGTSGHRTIKLIGMINEQVDLAAILGPPESGLTFDCAEVIRINSIGIKNWVSYFGQFAAKEIPFRFKNLSSALVEHLNAVKNFACGGVVESILLPFHCDACDKVSNLTADTVQLKTNGLKIPSAKCQHCGGPSEFDDIWEEYVGFLR